MMVSGTHLVANDNKLGEGLTSDPFIAVSFGSNPEDVRYSTFVEASVNPVFPPEAPANTTVLGGIDYASDVLVVKVWDKDVKQFGDDGKVYHKCGIIGEGQIKASELPYGSTIRKRIPLTIVQSKDPERPTGGDGGFVTLVLNPADLGAEPFLNPVAKPDGYTIQAQVVNAKGIPASDSHLLASATADPFVACEIVGLAGSLKKTKVIQKSLNPVFGDEFTWRVKSLDGLVLKFTVRDKSVKGAAHDEDLASFDVPLEDYELNKQTNFVDVRMVKLFEQAESGGTITLNVLVTEGGGQICTFDWGSNNSSHASSFGECDSAHGYGPLPPPSDEERAGYHLHEVVRGDAVEHLLKKATVKVDRVKGTGLAQFKIDIYGIRHGVLKDKKANDPTAVKASTGVIAADQAFALEAVFEPIQPGEWLGVLVRDEAGNCVSLATKQLKELSGEVALKLPLLKAPLNKVEKDPAGGYGFVSVTGTIEAV
jgi:hypothetical protein